MRGLYKYLQSINIFESAGKDARLLHTPEEALEFFKVEPDSKQGLFIQKCYELAPKSEEGDIIAPFVAGYQSKKGFAMRRWVRDNLELQRYMEKEDISTDSIFSNKIYKGYHNTTLEKLDKFPNSSEEEIFIAMTLNIKSLGKEKSEQAMKYALFGDQDKELSEKEKEIYDKYFKYYTDNKDIINERAKKIKLPSIEGEDDGPELFTKCSNQSVKSDIQDSWKEDGNYSKYPNYTPKSDLVSNKGRNCSLKKANGAQAMSGGMNETAATLMTYSYLLDKDTQKKLDSLFKDEEGNPIDWNGKDDKRNKKLNSIIKDIFKNKDSNKKFILAVLTEAITGAAKFGEKSRGTANEIITWTEDGEIFSDDIETYIYKTYESISADSVTINHKSSGKVWSVMRLFLPKHSESYTKLTEDEKNKMEEIEIIRSVRSNESIKKRKSEEEEADVKDENGNIIKVIIKTGPQGGKYYINSKHNKTYVKKGSNGSYEIKK